MLTRGVPRGIEVDAHRAFRSFLQDIDNIVITSVVEGRSIGCIIRAIDISTAVKNLGNQRIKWFD
jgi:hypothetical protein